MTTIYRARPGATVDECMKGAAAALALTAEEILRRDEWAMVVDNVPEHEIAEAMSMHRQHVRAFLDVELADLRRRLANSAN
jgi:hypothetical protein